jgi:hypothetical protein
LLKEKVGDNVVISTFLPKVDNYGMMKVNPLDRKVMKKDN